MAMSRLTRRMLVTSRKMTNKMTTSQLWSVLMQGSAPASTRVALLVHSIPSSSLSATDRETGRRGQEAVRGGEFERMGRSRRRGVKINI